MFIYTLSTALTDLFGTAGVAVVRRLGKNLLDCSRDRGWIDEEEEDPILGLNYLFSRWVENNFCKSLEAIALGDEIIIRAVDEIDYEAKKRLKDENKILFDYIPMLSIAFLRENYKMLASLTSTKLDDSEHSVESKLKIINKGGE